MGKAFQALPEYSRAVGWARTSPGGLEEKEWEKADWKEGDAAGFLRSLKGNEP